MPLPVTLKVYRGDQLIATKEYDREIIKIGRLASAHLQLDDEKVSRIHSVIEVSSSGALSIIDMGSAEGTFVNGKRVNKGPINGGDEIKVGGTLIRVGLSPAASNLAAADGSGDLSALPATPATPASSLAQAEPAGGVVPSASSLPPPTPAELSQSVAADASAAPMRRSRPALRQGMPIGLELRFRWGDRMVGEFFL